MVSFLRKKRCSEPVSNSIVGFTKDVRVKWNKNTLFQNLKPGRRIFFLSKEIITVHARLFFLSLSLSFSLSLDIYIYICIYMCVCVCVYFKMNRSAKRLTSFKYFFRSYIVYVSSLFLVKYLVGVDSFFIAFLHSISFSECVSCSPCGYIFLFPQLVFDIWYYKTFCCFTLYRWVYLFICVLVSLCVSSLYAKYIYIYIYIYI